LRKRSLGCTAVLKEHASGRSLHPFAALDRIALPVWIFLDPDLGVDVHFLVVERAEHVIDVAEVEAVALEPVTHRSDVVGHQG
jgi:hypothetical protein